jgi:hypothetical protein
MGWSLLLVPALVGLTTLAVVAVAVRRRALPAGALRLAASRTLEWLGLVAAFVALNLVCGFLVVLAVRALGGFLSVYRLGDPSLVGWSILQATAFHWWWRGRSPAGP